MADRIGNVSDVSHMDGGEGIDVGDGRGFHAILILNDRGDFVVDSPKREEIGSNIGVGRSKFFRFGDDRWNLAALREFFDFGAFVWRARVDNDFSNVVQQAGEESAFARYV